MTPTKVGEKIRYIPKTIKEDSVTEGIVTDFEPQGVIFNQPMLCIKEIEHWIPAYECEVIVP
jgi:hypothetical protein